MGKGGDREDWSLGTEEKERKGCSGKVLLPAHTYLSKGNAGCFKHIEVRVQNHKNLSKSKRSALR